MKRLVQFPLADGGSVVVEVEDTEGGTVRAARPGEVSEQARMTFQEALAKVRPGVDAVVSLVRGLTEPPDEIGVAFGLKLTASAGAVIASAGVEANYTISLTWRADRPAKE